MKDWYEEIADRADVLDFNDEAVRRGLDNVHSVDGLARKIIDLFKVEHVAFFHFIGHEVFAAFIRSQSRQGICVHNQRLPSLVSGRPVAYPRKFRNCPASAKQTLGFFDMTKSRDDCYQRREAHLSPTSARRRSPVVAQFRFAP